MLRVVAAVIHDDVGQILIAQRPLHKHQGGLWEFPGGKIEPGESAEDALARELEEELGIRPLTSRPLLTVEHHYADKSVRLEVWRVTEFGGHAHGAEGQPIAWVAPDRLADFEFPAANTPILKAARLPETYAVTPDPSEITGDFVDWLEARAADGQWLLLRARSLSPQDYAAFAREAVARLAPRGVQVVLHDRPDLLARVPAAGVQLTSASLSALPEGWRRAAAGIAPDRYLAFSAHDAAELAKAWRSGADFVTLSPVMATPSHPGQPGMGWERWGELARQAGLPVYALGGLTPADVALAHAQGGQGVAGIRGFLLQD